MTLSWHESLRSPIVNYLPDFVQKEYLKAKMDELQTFSRTKNIRDLYRGINDSKKCYQPRTNILREVKWDLVTGFHSILAGWRKRFYQLLNVHGVGDARQTEIHTAEQLVSEPSTFGVEMVTEKLKETNRQVLIKFQQGLGQFTL
jgi:hypothetical protein